MSAMYFSLTLRFRKLESALLLKPGVDGHFSMLLPRCVILVHVFIDCVTDVAHGLGGDGRGVKPLFHHPLVVVT